jgi:hypothetical protein
VKIHLLDPFGSNSGVVVGEARLQTPTRNRNVHGSIVAPTGEVRRLALAPLDAYVSAVFAMRVGLADEVEK